MKLSYYKSFDCVGQKSVIFKESTQWSFRWAKSHIPSAWLREFLPLNQLELSSPYNCYKKKEIKIKNQQDYTREKKTLYHQQEKVI